MKLNNKGISLLELLISIIIVGVVLTFLFQLLVDLKNETSNRNYANANQVNRVEIIYEIQKDFSKYTLTRVPGNTSYGIITNNGVSQRHRYIYFYFKVGNTEKYSLLTTYKDLITYTNVEGTKFSWKIKDGYVSQRGKFVSYVDDYTNNYFIKFNIPIYSDPFNDKNANNLDDETYINNAVDDIEITYYGKKSDLNLSNYSDLTSSTDENTIILYQ